MVRITKEQDERRRELLETADRLFTEKGFASVRVSDIVAAMGVAQGTFYYYFPSKDEALVVLLEQKWSQIAAYIGQQLIAYTDPVTRLSAALAYMLNPGAELTADPHYRLLMDPAVAGAFHPAFDAARARSLLPVMSGVIGYGIGQGAFPALVNEDEVVSIVFLGISAYMHTVDPHSGLQRAVSSISEMVSRVLSLSPGTLNLDQFLMR